MITVAIPTIKDNSEQIKELNDYLESSYGGVTLVVVNEMNSAAINRNKCIDRSNGNIIVMVDDDITGFYDGWIDDLILPLFSDNDECSIVSARFLNRDNKMGNMLGDNSSKSVRGSYQIACHSDRTMLEVVPTATIAFRKSDGVRFDESYIGAVYEDTDFCMQYRKKFPNRHILINNRCFLIHHNEQKRGGVSGCVKKNRVYFNKKWGTDL